MQLNNFLHLINDLDKSYSIFFKQEKNGPQWPISKVTLTSSKCIFVAQQDRSAKTIKNVMTLLAKINQKNIPLVIQLNQTEYSFFGIQIDPIKHQINIF
ncbi:hypothetical protein [Lactobacillus hominis]|uniref:hypothetical protein n=1 Tax=Lactobacillus hominis TaxID=1203033 RepID=UPI0023F1BA61|nr:hypothetical protein [Lactobacillus hominis]